MRSPSAALLTAILITAITGGAWAESTPVLDGKKTKQLVLKGDSVQDLPGANPTDAQAVSCRPPACTRLEFIYRPAKGVTASLGVRAHWWFPTITDVDLYLVGNGKIIARCVADTGNTRRLTVAPKKLKRGALYTAIMYYSHSFGEHTALTVTLPEQVGPPAPTGPTDTFEVLPLESCTT